MGWAAAILTVVLIHPSAWAADSIRHVFKTDSGAVVMSGRSSLPMSFGLSPKQMEQISDLTQGQVVFSGYRYMDLDASQSTSAHAHPNHIGVIQLNVPPPFRRRPSSQRRSGDPDPDLKGQWWIEKLKAPEAWALATGKGTTVADCDAGYHHDESDLAANLVIEQRFDLSDRDEPMIVNDGPYAFHGTAVTAILAGVRDQVGTNGLAYDARVIPLQNFNYDHRDDIDKEEATAACVLRAIAAPGVSVILLENQMANGSSEAFAGTRDAVRLAVQSGLSVVSAAGNYSVELSEELKDDTGSVIVGALGQDDRAAAFTNFGDRITIGAYGENLYTLYGPKGFMSEFGGTSGAAPQAAAAVAMMREVNPLLTPWQIRSLLQSTRGLDDGNRKAGGRLDLAAAVHAARLTPGDIQGWVKSYLFRQELVKILRQ